MYDLLTEITTDNEEGEKKMFIGYYRAFTTLTYLGVVFAVFGIVFALNQNIWAAILCLMFSGCCDMFDGTVARRTKRSAQEKFFGVQIDSMADLVSFGVLPAMIGYALGMNKLLHIFVLVAYILAALIRLAYFNVTEMALKAPRKYYEGLPVTSVALIIPILYYLMHRIGVNPIPLYSVSLALISVAFLSKLKIPKPKTKDQVILGLIGAAIAILIVSEMLVK